MKALAAAALGLQWSNIMVMVYEVMLWLYYSCVTVMLRLLLRLLCQLGERLCYGCCASQGRINVPAAPTVPRVLSQPLSSHLAHSCEDLTHWKRP